MTATQDAAEPRVRAIAVLNAPVQEWTASILSLTRSGADVLVLAGDQAPRAGHVLADMDVQVESWPLSRALAEVGEGAWDLALVVTSPTILPRDPYASAAAVLADDRRIATVSFFSNNADYVSFPYPGQPSGQLEPGWDENTLTERLRALHKPGTWAPIPLPAGGAVAVSPGVVRTLGAWEDCELGAAVSVVDFALRGARRGFRSVLDPRTFLTRPSQRTSEAIEPLTDPERRMWLEERHPLAFALYDRERTAVDTPLEALATMSRGALMGLRVLMECDVLGPTETGTQVALLATIDALVGHPGIRELLVGVPGASIPPYAWTTLTRQGVRVVDSSGYRFETVSGVDLIYRPYQPTSDLPFGRWREVSSRIVASLLDLIAYENGAYHDSAQSWLDYRASIRAAVGCVDGLVAISQDTARAIAEARLPIAAERVSVVELGTDHLEGADEAERVPSELTRRGIAGEPFLFVLGAAYPHKNRDLAIKAWRLLLDRGHRLNLVLAGVMGPASSRNDEALLVAGADTEPVVLPDVSRAERAWLYRHASVVLYPTSAEGFGLVPFEAAAAGRPCAFVSFGPLAELLDGVGGAASDWTPEAFADAVEGLLTHDGAASQVAAIRAKSADLTWTRMADRLVAVFLDVLARPRAASTDIVERVERLATDLAVARREAEGKQALEAETQELRTRLHSLSPVIRMGGFVSRNLRRLGRSSS